MESKALRRFWHRLVGWTLFLAALAGIAVGIHVELLPAPRWTIKGAPRDALVSADGKTLLTCVLEAQPGGAVRRKGPLESWDVSTGRLLSLSLQSHLKCSES